MCLRAFTIKSCMFMYARFMYFINIIMKCRGTVMWRFVLFLLLFYVIFLKFVRDKKEQRKREKKKKKIGEKEQTQFRFIVNI